MQEEYFDVKKGAQNNIVRAPKAVFRYIDIPDQICRSTIIFLISAMAFAGFKPFGHVFEQFMMVWQR